MRTCNGCTLCCTLERVPMLKPPNQKCHYCDEGVGCRIFNTKPIPCNQFECEWRKNEAIPEEMRPDRIGMYAFRLASSVKITIDPRLDKPSDTAQAFIELFVHDHKIIVTGRQLNFAPSDILPVPEKLNIEWFI